MIRITSSLLAKPALFIFAGIGITLATTGVTTVSLYEMRLDAMAQACDAATNLVLSLQKETERNLDIYQLAMRDVVTSLETPSILQLTPDARQTFAERTVLFLSSVYPAMSVD
ncbi:hypothetical protein ABH944_001110 [Caballeronia udeis]|uniref:Uncharacterized protein n=1 Tax=Caballeronia udeis TaxID=1232866 RepID=A0ABW8MCQ3_9BURK